jgi:hypothetical protein
MVEHGIKITLQCMMPPVEHLTAAEITEDVYEALATPPFFLKVTLDVYGDLALSHFFFLKVGIHLQQYSGCQALSKHVEVGQ